MFPSSRTSTLAQRALGALRLTRSFLLLEDDYDVDWEVDQDEHSQAPHPHRAPLRGRVPARRPGSPERVSQPCLCPVGGMSATVPVLRLQRGELAPSGSPAACADSADVRHPSA
jgi:hypothetical protein